jgi:hypothetical protein
VVAKVRERLAVNKQRSQKFHKERFNLKKLNNAEGKQKYRAEVSNRFALLGDLDTKVEINSTWETFRDNIKFQPKRVSIIMNLRSKIHGSMKDALTLLLFNFALEYAIRKGIGNAGGTEIKLDTSASLLLMM